MSLFFSHLQAKLETKALKAKRPGFTDERYNETSYYYDINSSKSTLNFRAKNVLKAKDKMYSRKVVIKTSTLPNFYSFRVHKGRKVGIKGSFETTYIVPQNHIFVSKNIYLT